MRGYFGIGVEKISKPMNLGNIIRSSHAFGASFVFTIEAHQKVKTVKSDTGKSLLHIPYYDWQNIDEMVLPRSCKLIGVELTDDAINLPSFNHPINAAYIFGPEKGSLSGVVMQRCGYIVKIPTKFCVNVGVAAAIVMYDRIKSL